MKICSNSALSQARYILGLCAGFWRAGAGGQQSASKPDYVVSRPVINMYSSASADSDVVSQALYGSGVLSLEKKKEWVHIRTGDDYTGWVAEADITPLQSIYAPDGKAVRVVELSANLYREPSVTKHAPVLNLPWEARLEVIPGSVEKAGRWIKVKLVNGQTAYVEQGNV